MTRVLLIWLAVALVFAASAQADEAGELAAAKGITVALAEHDLAIQREGQGIGEREQAALGGGYAGVWLNLKTGYWMVPLAPGGSKTVAKEAAGSVVAWSRFPAVKRSYAQIMAKVAALESANLTLRNKGELQVAANVQANTARVLIAKAVPLVEKERIKAEAKAAEAQSAVEASLVNTASGCVWRDHRLEYPGGSEEGFCTPNVEGGSFMQSTPAQFTNNKGEPFWSNVGCTVGFNVSREGVPYILTAGHCFTAETPATMASWVPRETMGSGSTGPYPIPPSASECQYVPVTAELDSGGDMGIARIENCEPSDLIHFWGPEVGDESPLVSNISCIAGNPACPPRSWERAVPGMWECHVGGNSRDTACGEVIEADVISTIGYNTGTVAVEHTDHFCASQTQGNSGGPTFVQEGGHYGATGILIAGGPSSKCPSGVRATAQGIVPALAKMGVNLP